MILGVGTDILDIARIKKLFAKRQDKLKQHILSTEEIEEFHLLKNDNNKIKICSKRSIGKSHWMRY